jgi:16S rRNA processing protein RimM
MEDELIHLGTITKTHGYKGELVFVLKTLKTDSLSEPEWFFIERYDEKVPYRVESIQVVDDSKIIVKLADVDDESTAKLFAGSGFFLPAGRLNLGLADDILLAEGKGWKVFNGDDFLGEISDVTDNKSQLLLTVVAGDREFLIPFVEDFVVESDVEDKVLVLDLPEGLIDL